MRGPRPGALRCAACNAVMDLSWLQLPRGIRPTDVDGLMAIHNRTYDALLFLEFKRSLSPTFPLPDESFPKAQLDALVAISRKPDQDLLLVIGTGAEPRAYRWCFKGTWLPEMPAGRLRLQAVIAHWIEDRR